MRLFREGDRSHQVADIQMRLRSTGLELDDEPGAFGRATTQAVKTFQQRRGLLVDGIVGPNTWGELVETQWRLGDRVIYRTHPMMRGDDVADLQRQLNALGFDAGREDGIYGPDTDHAVRSFQREYGLAEDGLFGAHGHAALTGLRANRGATAAALREELKRSEKTHIGSAFVVVDPGHGGTDRGDCSSSGLFEADLCWSIATGLAGRLIRAGARARLTRTEAESPDVHERARRANQLDADIVVSLHLNSHGAPTAHGASTYYFPASRAGEQLADGLQQELVKVGVEDCRSHARSYAILKETRMPAVLVEPAFITNPADATRLEDPLFRAQLADAMTRAISRYYEDAQGFTPA